MARATRWMRLGVWTAALGATLALVGAEQPAGPGPAAPTQPASQPSSEQVLRELLSKREANPLIEPVRRPPLDAVSGLRGPVDPMLAGVAPGAEAVTPRREGALVVARRGRLIHSPAGHAIFTFEGDSREAPEPPMILEPCHMLEEMEDAAKDRGDKIVFVVSGQVLAYQGANYLMPTMMHVAVDQGNIKH